MERLNEASLKLCKSKFSFVPSKTELLTKVLVKLEKNRVCLRLNGLQFGNRSSYQETSTAPVSVSAGGLAT